MKNKKIDKIVSEKVSSKIEELKQLGASELLSLPQYTAIKFETAGKEQELGIWHETTENGDSLIVAQCKNTHFLGIGNMYAEGFLINSSGNIEPAPEELMLKYT